MKENSEKANDSKKDQLLTILIKTPLGDWEESFNKTMKIEELIQAVIAHFSYDPKGQYELREEKDPKVTMNPSRPLVSFGLVDRDVLVFIDFGQAV